MPAFRRVLAALAVGLLGALTAGSFTEVGRAAPAGCAAQVTHEAAPARLSLGQETTVTITVQADCSRLQVPVHVALVLDNSVGMGGPRMEDMRRGVAAFVDSLDFTTARMGLATYYSHADVLSELTADPVALKALPPQFRPRNGSNLAMAVRAGRQILERGRSVAVGPDVEEVLVLLVGTPHDGATADVLAEARLARDAGMVVVTIASGNPDLDTLQAMASGPQFFYNVGISSQYPEYFRRIARDLTSVHVLGAQVTDTLPANMPYVWGSGVPAPRVRGRDLSWLYASWPPEGVTIAFNVTPGELGRHALSAAGEVRLEVDRGPAQVVPLPAAFVEVTALPTATPPPPTATLSPTATAPPTATPAPRRLYLPYTLRGHCRPAPGGVDVVLVLDTSTSMLELAAPRMLKLDLAQDAASLFIDALDLPDDQAAVVAFQRQALVLMGLSGDRGSLQSSLALLHGRVDVGTRLDLGLSQALDLLAGPGHRPGNRPVVVVLTDGQVEAPDRARAAAASARATGVTLYAIGLGADVNGAMLADLAGDPARYFFTPDGADLARIYLDIARRTACAGPAGP